MKTSTVSTLAPAGGAMPADTGADDGCGCGGKRSQLAPAVVATRGPWASAIVQGVVTAIIVRILIGGGK